MIYYTLKITGSLPLVGTTLYEIDTDNKMQSYAQFSALKQYSAVPPRLWEIVNITLDGKKYSMLVDEEGLIRDEPLPINHIASELYSAMQHPIVGDVFILVPDPPELYWLDDHDLQPWVDLFEHWYNPNMSPYIYWKREKITL